MAAKWLILLSLVPVECFRTAACASLHRHLRRRPCLLMQDKPPAQQEDDVVTQPISNGIPRGNAPDDPGQAIGIVSELKANAALFSAFAFGSLNLPSPLLLSESKATSLGGGMTTTRPLPTSELLPSFVVLDTLTLCLMLTCVAAAQLLIYRLADGSYGTVKYSTEDFVDPRDTPTGRLVTQYRAEFYSARISFFLGLFTLLASVAVKALAIFDETIALAVVGFIGATGSVMLTFFASSYLQVFEPLDKASGAPAGQRDDSFGYKVPFLPQSAVLGACAAVVLGAMVEGNIHLTEPLVVKSEQGLGARIRSFFPKGSDGASAAKVAKESVAQAQSKPSSSSGSAAT